MEQAIAVYVFIIIIACVLLFLIPFLIQKVGKENLEKIIKYVKLAVEAAEQIISGSGKGAEKKEFVKEYLTRLGIKVDIDTLNILIESAVHELNKNETK